MYGSGKKDYKSFMPASTIRILDLITICLIVLTLASSSWFNAHVTVVIGVVMICVLIFSLYMQSARNRMGAGENGLMKELADFTLSKLPLDPVGGDGPETRNSDSDAGDIESVSADTGDAADETEEESSDDNDVGPLIIDIGCFTACTSARAALRFPKAEIVGAYSSDKESSIGQCRTNMVSEGLGERVVIEEQNIASMDYADGIFDAALTCYGFHRDRENKDKRALLEESLRVVRKGGAFAFTDFFSNERTYGDIVGYLGELKERMDIAELHYAPNIERMDFVPALLRAPWLLMDTGIIFGIR
ncbi:MAG: class I SAM-dependent methyltransferase [Eubacteriales bacterium]|nr:class I SAM-dependent methyltransferase [Eubacteriales bacterium]